MIISSRAKNCLEIEKVLSLIWRNCRSELGVNAFRGLEPASNLKELSFRQAVLLQYQRYTQIYGDLPWSDGISSIRPLIEGAKATGILSGEELLLFKKIIRLALAMREIVPTLREEGYAELANLLRSARDFSAEAESLSVLSDDGRLYDHASSKLKDIRLKLAHAKERARAAGQSLVNDRRFGGFLREPILYLKDERFVVLVKRESVSMFPGVALELSGSGNSVYMEPHSLVRLNNEIAVLVRDEREEERRILRELTEMLLRRERHLLEAEDLLGMVDLLYAATVHMEKGRWTLPETSRKSSFSFHSLLHPLLGEGAVPIDIRCGEHFRILVITGPNTGGKTVALKSTGLAVALAWLGLPIPASAGSWVGDIDRLDVDIGDEQSIEQNLSTFSSHLKNIVEMLKEATGRSLFLLDELGAGTDPQEGAALGVAILEAFLKIGSVVLATTHHNLIKRYALTTPGIETASVEFDSEKLTPTYRLLFGIPGRSNALLIAERLGLPKDVVLRAREELGPHEVSVEEMIGQLQEKQARLDALEEQLFAEKEEVNLIKRELEERLFRLEAEKEKALAAADRKAQRIIHEAEEAARAYIKKIEKASKDAALREASRHQKKLKEIARSSEKREERRIEKLFSVEGGTPRVGDAVSIAGMAVKGIVESIEGDKAVVRSGAVRLEVPVKRIATAKSAPEEETLKVRVEKPVQAPGPSIMVRGLTIDEAIPMVERYLDQAFRAGYGEVAVIHGRGEGVLRRAVQELLRTLPYVEDFRLGGPGEGGEGVTIVRFKR